MTWAVVLILAWASIGWMRSTRLIEQMARIERPTDPVGARRARAAVVVFIFAAYVAGFVLGPVAHFAPVPRWLRFGWAYRLIERRIGERA